MLDMPTGLKNLETHPKCFRMFVTSCHEVKKEVFWKENVNLAMISLLSLGMFVGQTSKRRADWPFDLALHQVVFHYFAAAGRRLHQPESDSDGAVLDHEMDSGTR